MNLMNVHNIIFESHVIGYTEDFQGPFRFHLYPGIFNNPYGIPVYIMDLINVENLQEGKNVFRGNGLSYLKMLSLYFFNGFPH